MSEFDLNVPKSDVDAIIEYLGTNGIAFQRNASTDFVTISADDSDTQALKDIVNDMSLAHGIINELKVRPNKGGVKIGYDNYVD